MATSYPTTDAVTGAALTRADYGADKAVTTGRVQQLIDLTLCACRIAFPFKFAEQTTQATSYADLYARQVQFPDWGEEGAGTLTVKVEAKVSANNADIRLKDDTSGTTGDVVNLTNAAYEDKTLTLTVGSDWGDADRLIIVQGQVSNAADTLAAQETKVRAWFTD